MRILISLFFSALLSNTIVIPGDYLTIQNGIDAADDGDTVLISHGIHYESISIVNKSITLRSYYNEDQSNKDITGTIIYADENNYCITLENSSSTISGISLYSDYGAIKIENSNPQIVRTILFSAYNTSDAIYLNNSNAVLVHCTLYGFDNDIQSVNSSIQYYNTILLTKNISSDDNSSYRNCLTLENINSGNNLGGNIVGDPLFDIPPNVNMWYHISNQLDYHQQEYPWTGNIRAVSDGKDNNPHSSGPNYIVGSAEYQIAIAETEVCNEQGICKRIGDGEPNPTGDPDDDGFEGEDWFNGYDDDGDGLIDEDYFYADGIDNDGDCPGDTNGDGIVCGPGDVNVDEYIDGSMDKYIDGVDNDENGWVDDSNERASTHTGYTHAPTWGYNLDHNVIVQFGRQNEYINLYNNTKNEWYDPQVAEYSEDLCVEGSILVNGEACMDPHLKGTHIYNQVTQQLEFDVFIYDFGEDGKAGDGKWDDLQGDGEFQMGEPLNPLLGTFGYAQDVGLDGISGTSDEGEGDGIWQPGDGWIDINGNGIVELCSFGQTTGCDTYNTPDPNNYIDVWPPANGIWDEGEIIYDYGQDGLPGTGDFGEGDGILLAIDSNERDGLRDTGDNIYNYLGDPFTDMNDDDVWNEGEQFLDDNNDGIYTPPDYQKNWINHPGLFSMISNNGISLIISTTDVIDNDGDGLIDESFNFYSSDCLAFDDFDSHDGDTGLPCSIFYNTVFDYFKLTSYSPCINAGSDASFPFSYLNDLIDGDDIGALLYNPIEGCTNPLYALDFNPYADISNDDLCTCQLWSEENLDCIDREILDGIDNDNDWDEYADEFGWDDDKDGDGDPRDKGEFGWVDIHGNIFKPEHILEIANGYPYIRDPYDSPYYGYAFCSGENVDCNNSNWYSVGIDEYDPAIGIYYNSSISNVSFSYPEAYIESEPFEDWNNNGVYDDYISQNEIGTYSTQETYTDVNDNGVYDIGGWSIQIDWENTEPYPLYYYDDNGNLHSTNMNNSNVYIIPNEGEYHDALIFDQNTTTYTDENVGANEYVCYHIYNQQHYYNMGPNSLHCFVTPGPDGLLNKDNIQLPAEFLLDNPYPNPFNPIVNISFQVPTLSNITIDVYDLLGRKVTTLDDNLYSPGIYNINWDANKYSSGIYFIHFRSPNYISTKKITLIK